MLYVTYPPQAPEAGAKRKGTGADGRQQVEILPDGELTARERLIRNSVRVVVVSFLGALPGGGALAKWLDRRLGRYSTLAAEPPLGEVPGGPTEGKQVSGSGSPEGEGGPRDGATGDGSD